MNPARIQRRRSAGWKKPPNTVCVTRGTRWGNPFIVGKDGDARECCRKYAELMLPYSHHGARNSMADFMLSQANLEAIRSELAGMNLACWCPLGAPCHGDLLLAWANPLPAATPYQADICNHD